MSTQPTLRRSVGLGDAIFIGLGSMIGAGVFSAFAPAAQAAGGLLLVGLAIAAVVALCNALASAQLASTYPTSGGTYIYGREELGPWWGFFAGWSFVIGKTASCAAMALVFASYLAPPGWERPIAAIAVVTLTAVNLRGITRTAQLTRIIVILSLAALATAVVAMSAGGLEAFTATGAVDPGAYGVLQSAGLLFFAFAGYARVATMGEEVRDPERTIPRAIVASLAIVIAIYAVVGVTLLGALGPDGLAASTAPLKDAAAQAGQEWMLPVVTVGAAVASLGALLALIAGVGRTTLAMAREADLPRMLAAVHPRFHVPHHAEVALAAVVIVLVLTMEVRGAIGFSSFGVLLYYAIANASALHQKGALRRFPRPVFVVGLVGCIGLVVTLPLQSVIGGIVVLLLGGVYRFVSKRVAGRGTAAPGTRIT